MNTLKSLNAKVGEEFFYAGALNEQTGNPYDDRMNRWKVLAIGDNEFCTLLRPFDGHLNTHYSLNFKGWEAVKIPSIGGKELLGYVPINADRTPFSNFREKYNKKYKNPPRIYKDRETAAKYSPVKQAMPVFGDTSNTF